MFDFNFSDYEKQLIRFIKTNRRFSMLFKALLGTRTYFLRRKDVVESEFVKVIYNLARYNSNFQDLFYTSNFREKYKDCTIDVELFSLEKSTKEKHNLISYEHTYLDVSRGCFVTPKGTKIELMRIVRLNGEPFNIYTFLNEKCHPDYPFVRKSMLKLTVEQIEEIIRENKVADYINNS